MFRLPYNYDDVLTARILRDNLDVLTDHLNLDAVPGRLNSSLAVGFETVSAALKMNVVSMEAANESAIRDQIRPMVSTFVHIFAEFLIVKVTFISYFCRCLIWLPAEFHLRTIDSRCVGSTIESGRCTCITIVLSRIKFMLKSRKSRLFRIK